MAEYEHAKGYVINDSNYGSIFIGEDTPPPGEKGTTRPRQIEIHSSSDAALKLFSDGGFELQSQSKGTTARINDSDNIVSRASNGLMIVADNGGIMISAASTITFAAREIRFASSAHDETLVIRSSKNLSLQAGDNIHIEGAKIAIGAKEKIIMGCPGPVQIYSGAGVQIVEPRVSLCPKNLLTTLQAALSGAFPNIIF